MALFPVNDEMSYQSALERIEALWECETGTPEAAEMEALTVLVDAYEERHNPVPLPTLAEAIRFAMDQRGLKQKDLIGKNRLGAKSRVSELLNAKRNPTGDQMRAAFRLLAVPAEILLQENC